MRARARRLLRVGAQACRTHPFRALHGALGAAAVTVTWRAQAGSYVGDNRFEQFWNPGRRLARSFAAWDGSRGFGRVREDFWPGVTAPVAGLRALGLSPVAAEHLFHALLLTILGIGVVALLRQFRPTFGIEHVAAGFLAMFGPYSATFLIPSNLYASLALSPWLALAAVRGVRAEAGPAGHRQRWRSASAFALLVFLAGNTDPPGLLFALVPAVVIAVGAMERDGTRRRRVGAWLARVVPLTVATASLALVKVWLASASYSQRLADTESPEVTSLTSSFSESWRGLGLWLAYFRDSSGAARPQSGVLIASPVLVVATFALPVLALLGLAISRWSLRWTLATTAGISLVLLAGAYPTDNPSRFGDALLWVYDNVPFAAAFRSGYKAGAGLAIATALLVAVAVAELWRRTRPPHQRLVGAGLALLVLVVAFPFWSGNLYDDTRTLDDVPDYWDAATSWLDDQPGDGRVLVLPATTRTRYRWGWVGDDIFDALLRRPHAVDTSIPLSNPRSTDLLRALTTSSADPAQRDGAVAAIARRLGIRYIVLRNDVDWQDQAVPRPARFDGLRTDPTLDAVTAFGAPGQFTTDPRDGSPEAGEERRLRPVEILEVPDATAAPLVRGQGGDIVVSGDGDAWPRLAAADLLESTGVVRYSADLEAADLSTLLADRSPLVLTDTNRRHLDVVTGFRIDESHLLGPGEDLDRPTQSLFDRTHAETVAWFPDARSITATNAARSLAGFAPENRPAQAFDGDRATAWFTPSFLDALDQRLTVELREPTALGKVTVGDARAIDVRAAVQRVDVRVDGGPPVPVFLDAAGEGSIDLDGVTGTTIEFAVGETVGEQAGVAEIEVEGVDLTEWAQLPDDAWRTLGDDPAATEAHLLVDVERARSESLRPVESMLRRRFRTVGDRTFAIDARADVDASVTDAEIDALVGGDSPAIGSRRFRGRLDGQGAFAVDGDETTAWAVPPVAGETLTIRTTPGPGRVEVVFDSGDEAVVPTVVRAESAGRSLTAPVEAGRAVLDLGAVDDELVITLEAFGSSVDPSAFPTRVIEVIADTGTDSGIVPTVGPAADCRSGRLTVDGDEVPLRPVSTPEQIAADGEVQFSACETLTLEEGWHRIESTDRGALDAVHLATFVEGPDRDPDPDAAVRSVSADRRRLDVEGGAPFVLLSGESYDDGWRAEVDGEDLGPPEVFDTQSGWSVAGDPEATNRTVQLIYRPQRLVDAASMVTLAGLVTAASWLWVTRRRRGES